MSDPKRRGRPALDAATPSARICVTLTAKAFDAMQQQARRSRISLSALVRRKITEQSDFKNTK